MDQIAPPQNAIDAVGTLVARAGTEQDRLGWAIVQGEMDRLRMAEQTILAFIERAEGETVRAVPTDMLRRALSR